MRRKNDDRPATAKLSSFGDALGQLKNRLNSGSAQPAAPVQAAPETSKQGRRSGQPPRLTPQATARLHVVEPSVTVEPSVAPQAAAAPSPVPPRPVRPTCPIQLRKFAADRVRETVRGSTPELEDRPSEVSQATVDQIRSALERGVAIISSRPEPDFDGGYIVGFDMGTSSLKVAVRQPYRAGDPVAALTAPRELRSDGHPCLWQAVVWYNPATTRFTLTPEAGAIALGGFKTGIVGGHGNSWVLSSIGVTRAEAAVAFMALQIAYVIGWYAQERPLGPAAGDHFLGFNVGIPVAALDDKPVFDAFKRIVASAYDLAPIADDLNLKDVREVYQNSRPQLPMGFELVPELIAAISGYVAIPTSPAGAHMLVDVGASTLDIVSFNLIERSQVSVFTAGVDLFGAGALEVARLAQIDEGDFKRACDHQFYIVYGSTRSPTRAPNLFDPSRRRRPVQLLITGGGCATSLHKEFIEEMPRVLGDVPMIRPLPPTQITAEPCDLSRLLLAFGLTRDEGERLEARLPSHIEDLTPPGGAGPAIISKDQV